MNKRIAMLPGSFDPPTLGHVNIIRRASELYDRLYVIVANNIAKKYLFSAEEREGFLREIFRDVPSITIVSYDGLMVDFARENNVGVMVRGVRALVDFGYEFELAMTNKQMLPELEVLFMPTDPHYFLLRSSQIREMAAFGADVSSMVPEVVAEALKKKVPDQRRSSDAKGL